MAILQALLAILIHSAGKVFNTIFGWATLLLFGRMTEQKRLRMSFAACGAALWMLGVIGIIAPPLGVFLIAAALPSWVHLHQNLVRGFMIAIVLIVPQVVGHLVTFDSHKRKEGSKASKFARSLVEGWRFTAGLALVCTLMVLLAPVTRLKLLAKRWDSYHIPVLIKPGTYEAALDDIQAAFNRLNINVRRQKAGWMIGFPTKVLMLFMGNQMNDAINSDLNTFRGANFDVVVHPADLVISGPKKEGIPLRIALAEELIFSNVQMTWSEEANAIEDELKALWRSCNKATKFSVKSAMQDLAEIECNIQQREIDFDEWQILTREKEKIERQILVNLS